MMLNNDLPMIYCDMDGVLVDFFRGIRKLTGIDYSKYITEKHIVDAGHQIVREAEHFWRELPPTPDKHILWEFISKYEPSILTAKPSWDDMHVVDGKWDWTQIHTPVAEHKFHCVERKDKIKFAINNNGKPNLLIDDLEKNIEEFKQAGGIAIQHKSAATTIIKLKELGY